jgi:hypothetical protein
MWQRFHTHHENTHSSTASVQAREWELEEHLECLIKELESEFMETPNTVHRQEGEWKRWSTRWQGWRL